MSDRNSTYQAALTYMAADVYVNPVRVHRGANDKKDVRPIGRWRDTSSVSRSDAYSWWVEEHPDAGILIDCGKSGLVVVDCDGPEGIANWLALDPPEPMGVVRTPGRGEHWYYAAHPDHVIGNDQDATVAEHVDVRGLGGFVIAAPSKDWRGSYFWAIAPDWSAARPVVPDVVVQRMTAKKAAPVVAGGGDASPFDDAPKLFTRKQATEYVKKAKQALADTSSGFNGAINNFAMSCAHFPWLVDRELCAQLVIRALGPKTGWTAPDHQDRATINSAYSATEEGRSWVAVEVQESDRHEVSPSASSTAEEQSTEPEDRFTDAQMAGRLAREVLAGRWVYTAALGWLGWDGMRWAQCAEETLVEAIRRWSLEKYLEVLGEFRAKLASGKAEGSPNDDPGVKGWAGMQSLGRMRAVAALARGITLKDAAEFDTDPNVLNTPSGVVDLRTGEVMEHDAGRLITKITGVAYVAGAESPALKAALLAVPDEALAWLQLRLGEALTGHSGEQLTLLTGGGRNGKTLLMGSVFRAMGDYAAKVPSTLLLRARSQGAATPERMTLRGVRLAYMEETPEDGYMDATVVKDLLDAEVIEGRHLYKDIVAWKPTHSLFLNTNHPPTMGDTGDAPWRRLTRLDFPYRFRKADEEMERPTDRRGDPGLKVALGETEEGQAALLAWLVAGARRYYAEGMEQAEPACVRQAVQTWREESDDLLRFINAEMEFDLDAWVPREDLYEAFCEWMRRNGQRSPSVKTFAQRMASHSLLGRKIDAVRVRRETPGVSRHKYLDSSLMRSLSAQPYGYSGVKFRSDNLGSEG